MPEESCPEPRRKPGGTDFQAYIFKHANDASKTAIEMYTVPHHYNVVGMLVFPWKQYGDKSDIRDFSDYRDNVKEVAEAMSYLTEKYGISGFAATLGMDLWQGGEPTPDIRAQGYGIGLNVLKEYNIDGAFLHIWASERDHLGNSREVEGMLGERRTTPEQPNL